MKRFLFVFFAAMTVFFSFSAAAENFLASPPVKPEMSVEIDEGNPNFIYKNKRFRCSHGRVNHGGGCTRVKFYAVMSGAVTTSEGALKEIRLKIGLQNVEVEVSSELKKGSCLFDAVLKHELTHLALHRKIVKRFAPEIAKAVLSVAEGFSTPVNASEYNRISAVLKNYIERMMKEDEKQNALMDTDDAYVFQQNQCLRSEKKGK